MRGEQFQAREKTVCKLGRDGLVEENKATGEQSRVSERAADLSLGPDRSPEEAASRRAGDGGGEPKKRRGPPRPADAAGPEPSWLGAWPGVQTGEADAPPDEQEAPSMRMAEDASLSDQDTSPVLPILPPARGRRKARKKRRAHQTANLAEDGGRPEAESGEEERPRRDVPPHDVSDADGETERRSRLSQDGGRLCFEEEESDEARPAPRRGRLRFEEEERAAPQRAERQREADEKARRQREADAGRLAARAAGDAVRTVRDAGAAAQDAGAAGGPARPGGGEDPEPLSAREQKRLEKAEKRVEKSEKRLEKAERKLPAKRRLLVKKEYDEETGEPRRRLRFDKEVIPEGAKPALPRRAAGSLVWYARTAAVMKVHRKLREAESDNTALEAAHKLEFAAERSAGRVLRWRKNRLRTRPYRRLHRAERRLVKDQAELAWRTALLDRPELRKQWRSAKWWQKKRIKRKYAAAKRAGETAAQTRNAVTAAGQIVRFLARRAMARKSLLALAAMLWLAAALFSAGLSSCAAMLSGVQTSYIAASYLANETDISDSNLYYSEMETDLQIDIDKTEETYPGYDEYRYSVQEIGHDPYALMSYLSASFDAFRFPEIRAELEALFHEQYQLTREEIVETRYDSEGDPYNWYVLQTTLAVRSLNSIVAAKLAPGEQTSRYEIYQQTLGNRQAFGNPFSFPWLGYVSSPYGWRRDGTGGKEPHCGIDLAAAQGTPIRAIHDGRVLFAGEAEGYGLCVIVEDDKGYQARFAHCGGVSVAAGQEVRRGDTIAAVGGAGTDAGPHLHLEVLLNGAYLDPYYFVDTGGGYSGAPGGGAVPGEPGGPVIPDYPGEAPGDETFAAILAEAEKYIGYPYVWGGASPSTSFDCSGYVSWVINHSGWNFGRLTAQGLFNVCTPVSAASARPGDLVFFTRTYSTPEPVTHVGIYIGNNQMLHCGDPIGYADLGNSYWQAHFYAFGRLP